MIKDCEKHSKLNLSLTLIEDFFAIKLFLNESLSDFIIQLQSFVLYRICMKTKNVKVSCGVSTLIALEAQSA